MIFGLPWGLLGLLAIPAILGIHLYRRRFRSQRVSALWLYGRETPSAVTGRRRERLHNRPSLWLELLCAVLLCAHLVDLHFDSRQTALHHVIILDTRSGLAAVGADGRSAYDRAREALTRHLEALPRDDRVTCILSGRQPRLLVGPAAHPRHALATLDGWHPASGWHDLEPAIRLGVDQLAETADGDGVVVRPGILLVVGDRLTPVPRDAGLALHGQVVDNAGIVAAHWLAPRRGPEKLVVTVINRAAVATRRTLVVADASGAPLVSREIELPADGDRLITAALPANPPDRLELRLDGADGLAVDDRCTLFRPRPATVLIALHPGTLTGPARERFLTACRRACDATQQRIRIVPLLEDAQLCLVAGDVEVPGNAWCLRLRPGGGPAVFGPFPGRRGHPLLRDLDATACLWSGGAPLADYDPEEVLLAADDRALITLAEDGERPVVTCHLDLAHARVDEHVFWPGLIDNLILWRTDRLPGVAGRNHAAGTPWTCILPGGATALWLRGPGAPEPVRLLPDARGRVIVPGLDLPGVYRLRLDAVETPVWTEVSIVAADARLSDCRAAVTLQRPATAGGEAPVARERGALAHLLPLLLTLLTAALAWRCFESERRRSVRVETREVADA